MEKLFIPFELAVKLKELGFDGECLAYYSNKDKYLFFSTIKEIPDEFTLAPLWGQTFDWFTRKGLHSYIEGAYPWFRYYINTDNDRYEGFKHLKIEEARQDCLEKLIEIVADENIKN